MANYCDNVVYISTTDKDKLLSLITRIIEGTDDDWEYDNYANKVVSEKNIQEVDGSYSIRLRYDTRWRPNVSESEKLVEEGFSIIHKFWEPGCGFCGVFITDDNGKFVSSWQEEDCDFHSMVRINEDQISDHDYVSFSPEELKAMKFGEIGELLIIGDKPIGIWAANEELLLLSSGELIDADSWELEGRTYFSRYGEFAEECGWEE